MQSQRAYFLLSFLIIVVLCTFQYISSSGEIARAHLLSYRNEFLVKLGTTTDKSIFLSSSVPVHLTTAEKKISNHNRTFRAYIVRDVSGVSRVAFESAKPHGFFQLNGNYAVSPETVGIVWMNNSTVSFDGVNAEGIPTRFELRLSNREIKETVLSKLSVRHQAPVIDAD